MNVKMVIAKVLRMCLPPILFTFLYNILWSFQSLLIRGKIAHYSKLHFGCGGNIIEGWANIDLDGSEKAIGWDCTKPLPIKSGAIKFIYNEHFIEHITFDHAKGFLAECHRVLQPGGVLRISTPNLRKAIDEYLAGRVTEWTDVGFVPATPCRLINESMRFWGHEFVYDHQELEMLLKEIGFAVITRVAWRESRYEELKGLECRPFHGDIILEATR